MASAKRARWLAASSELEVLAALHPDSPIAALAETAIDRGNLVSIRLDEVAHGNQVDDSWLKSIPEAHRKAVDAARELVRLVQQ